VGLEQVQEQQHYNIHMIIDTPFFLAIGGNLDATSFSKKDHFGNLHTILRFSNLRKFPNPHSNLEYLGTHLVLEDHNCGDGDCVYRGCDDDCVFRGCDGENVHDHVRVQQLLLHDDSMVQI